MKLINTIKDIIRESRYSFDHETELSTTTRQNMSPEAKRWMNKNTSYRNVTMEDTDLELDEYCPMGKPNKCKEVDYDNLPDTLHEKELDEYVDKDLYKTLKLSKRGEFREQDEEPVFRNLDDEQPDLSGEDLPLDIEKFSMKKGAHNPRKGREEEMEDTTLLHYVRLFFIYLQSSGIDVIALVNQIETEGIPDAYYQARNKSYEDWNSVRQGMKYVGMNSESNRMIGNEYVYALLINYLHNDGARANFKNRDIKLIPAISWEVDVSVEEDVVEYSTVMCDVFGRDKEKVEDVVVNNPEAFEVDREQQDSDYSGDYRNVNLLDVKQRQIILTPQSFGL